MAAIGRAEGGQWGDPCDQPPTVRAVWRFDKPGPRRILLCGVHADGLAGDERLSHVVRYYDAAVEDVR